MYNFGILISRQDVNKFNSPMHGCVSSTRVRRYRNVPALQSLCQRLLFANRSEGSWVSDSASADSVRTMSTREDNADVVPRRDQAKSGIVGQALLHCHRFRPPSVLMADRWMARCVGYFRPCERRSLSPSQVATPKSTMSSISVIPFRRATAGVTTAWERSRCPRLREAILCVEIPQCTCADL
jgi:hypothetical protein